MAFLLIFQAITLEGWTDIMSYLMNGVSPFFGAVYMVLPTLTPKPNPNPNPNPSPNPNPNPNPNQARCLTSATPSSTRPATGSAGGPCP